MPIKIFFCYAREDTALLEQLKTHLKALEREQSITMWYDRNISAGKEWGKEIDSHLNSSQIILLLISADFLASEYCYGVEMKRALELHERGEARVIPFIARPVDWENEPFHKLQALPRDGQPLTTWADLDEAFVDSVKNIRAVVHELNSASQRETVQSQQTKALTDKAVPISLQNADTIRQTSEAQITTPSVIILLGSTAALSALELMRHMLTLRASDQRRVALVYIDTDEPNSSVLEFRQRHKRIFQEFPLRIAVPAGISHISRVPQGPDDKGEPREQHTYIQGKEPQYFANGAGGIRNNGHVAACFHYQSIYDTFDRALVTVTRVGTEQNATRINEVQVNIVAFLGGGTGGGILPDVTVMVHDLLANHQYKQRINLFCMVPGPVRGVHVTDLNWRRSNATACLLELIAYSGAAVGDKSGRYAKYMHNHVHRLTSDALANEVYLVGHASMDDASSIPRIVGLDLFQRTTNASGVGFLEHSKWVDRRTLGETDDRGIPTVFGTSCPLEVCFPVEETATAYAQISASHLLPLLASYQPSLINVSDNEKRQWELKWSEVACFDAHTNDPKAIKISTFNRNEFDDIDQRRLDLLWNRLERFERDTDKRVAEIITLKQEEEEERIGERIDALLQQPLSGSLLHVRLQHLNRLQEEYHHVLENLLEAERPKVPARPTALEAHLTQPGNIFTRFRTMNRDFGNEVYEAYMRRLHEHAAASRYQFLEKLLKDLIKNVQEAINDSLLWFQETKVDEHILELQVAGMISMAWQGQLELPHPHQRHIFDLRTLRALDGRSLAAEQLYCWAIGGDKAVEEGGPIDYSVFVTKCVDYLTTRLASGKELEEQSAGKLADRVVDFFHDYYIEKFQNMNLFELLDKAAPASQKGQSRVKQISNYLLEHLRHMRGLMASLIAFDAELWRKGPSTLETSIYLGMHWRDGHQLGILDQALDTLGSLTNEGQVPMKEPAIDPHRLQLVYGQHAISLSTVQDFCLDQHSAMEAYLTHQQKWIDPGDSTPHGFMPVHSSGEAERLVWDENALGYGTPLPKRIIR